MFTRKNLLSWYFGLNFIALIRFFFYSDSLTSDVQSAMQATQEIDDAMFHMLHFFIIWFMVNAIIIGAYRIYRHFDTTDSIQTEASKEKIDA